MEDAMRSPHIDDFVRLMTDIPELALNRGEIGVVRSTWFAPSVAYEVEFHQIGHDYQTRALLLPDQVEVEEGSLFKHLGSVAEGDALATNVVAAAK
ncbi:MAG TPA: DUF4926 domain-containing protein [Tepidisphaeraceae bacterium]|nr:DUF4926 domain-containing protein [Tepidisphaeraceae bacterium]